ncbi:MAG: tRNA-dihydrouridine synthase family protein [archaeon]
MAYKIGNLKLKDPYFLAPLAGVNDIAFRILCSNAGAGLVYTGMIHPLSRAKIPLDDNPAIQLFSTNEEGIADFIRKHKNTPLFDFNLGCSVVKAKEKGFGAFLHDKKDTIKNILQIMRKSTKKPITIKLRKTEHALKILKIAEEYVDAVCIHPRTNVQGYSGKPDVSFALEFKKKTSLPVIYSGDVNESNALELLEKFEFVMLGRSAMGNPNLFAHLTNKKETFFFDDYLKLASKYHIKFSQIKSQAILFTKSSPNASKLRGELFIANNTEEIKKIMC